MCYSVAAYSQRAQLSIHRRLLELMNKNSCIRLYAAATLLLASSTPALAQFQRERLEEPATGEKYHIEASGAFWRPGADMSIRSESLGIPGDVIDFKRDLGLADQRFRQLKLELRANRHKFRFQYIPIVYQQEGVIERTIVFNGQTFRAGLPVNTTLDWRAYRFGYEYDFISRPKIWAGFIVDLKETDVHASLDAPSVHEATHAAAPIPTIGGVVRGYVRPNISITGELTGLTLGWAPESLIGDNTGHYTDLDIYGTVNFNNYIGAQIGYRAFDVAYGLRRDSGSFVLKGLYVGVVGRY